MRLACCILLIVVAAPSARAGDAGEGPPAELAERWLRAVAADDADTALEIARQIAPEPADQLGDPRYPQVFNRKRVDADFLTDGFNLWDYQSWRHAWFFQQLARRLTANDPEKVLAIYDAVIERIEPRDRKKTNILWPYNIWQNGWGLCDRSAWVFCELAYQMGWHTQIVYLVNPHTEVSPHTIAEIRGNSGRVYFVDTYARILLPGRTVESVAGDEALLATLWPGHPQYAPAMQACRFWTPSYPQDYCVRNQRLHARLVDSLGERCPRFGEEPQQRLSAYRKLRAANGETRFQMDFWLTPLVKLRKEFRQRKERMRLGLGCAGGAVLIAAASVVLLKRRRAKRTSSPAP
jgi:hypothetical protein